MNKHCIEWNIRKLKIIQELEELNGDIICLQEMDPDIEFINEMGKLGYDVLLIYYYSVHLNKEQVIIQKVVEYYGKLRGSILLTYIQ